MASLGNLVGTKIDSGHPSTTTINCTDDQDGTLHLFWLTSFIDPSFGQSIITAVSDSKGGTWALSSSIFTALPLIGATDAFYYDGTNFVDFLIGSFMRTGGTPLENGDTITVTYGGVHTPDYATFIAQCINETNDVASHQQWGEYATAVDITTGTFVSYSNGLPGYATQLWRVEYSTLDLNPAPAINSAFIGLFACYGGSGFVPESIGTNAVEVTNGPLTLALTFSSIVPANGITIEPGGSWTVPPAFQAQEGNYQFIGTQPTSIFWFFYQGAWYNSGQPDNPAELFMYKDGDWYQNWDNPSYQLFGLLDSEWQK